MITVQFTPEQHRNLLDALAIADKVQKWANNTMESEYDGKYIELAVEIDYTLDIRVQKMKAGKRVQS